MSDVPEDKGGTVYIIFFILGIATLLPWNVFINSSDYFSFRFQGTSYQNNFENFFGICFNVSNVFSLAYATKYGNNISMFNKVVIPLLVQALVFSITTAIVLVPPASISGMTVFAITIPTCLVSGLLTALLQGGTFGLAARFPPKYSQAVMAGQGLGGAGVSLAKLATLLGAAANSNAATYKDLRMSNFTYFLIASLFSFVSVAAYLMLDKLPFAKYYCTGMALSSEEKKEPLLDDGGTDGDSGGEISTEKLREIYGKIKDKMIAVLLVFWVTLAVFPSVTVHIQSMHNYDDPSKDLSFSPDGNGAGRFFGDIWVPFMFLAFNGMDLAGRMLAGSFDVIPSDKLFLASAARLIFIPLFMVCNVRSNVATDKSLFPILLKTDAAPLIIMFLFALSNGYVSSRLMMVAPSFVPAADQQLAGMMMAFFLVIGLGLGSVTSFFTAYLTCECNPFSG